MNEASSQYSIQQQAHALLQICSEENDIDEVEAERIILLAGNDYVSSYVLNQRFWKELLEVC